MVTLIYKELYYIYPHGDEVSNVDVVFLCKSYTGEAKADMIESDAVGFFAIDNLPDNISPPCIPALNKFRDSRCTI